MLAQRYPFIWAGQFHGLFLKIFAIAVIAYLFGHLIPGTITSISKLLENEVFTLITEFTFWLLFPIILLIIFLKHKFPRRIFPKNFKQNFHICLNSLLFASFFSIVFLMPEFNTDDDPWGGIYSYTFFATTIIVSWVYLNSFFKLKPIIIGLISSYLLIVTISEFSILGGTTPSDIIGEANYLDADGNVDIKTLFLESEAFRKATKLSNLQNILFFVVIILLITIYKQVKDNKILVCFGVFNIPYFVSSLHGLIILSTNTEPSIYWTLDFFIQYLGLFILFFGSTTWLLIRNSKDFFVPTKIR